MVDTDNARALAAGDGVEAGMMAAVRQNDDTAYFAALREARLVVPVRQMGTAVRMVARLQPQRLMFEFEGRHHMAVFTSADLAQRGVAAAFGGETSGWRHESYDADTFVSTFTGDTPILINAGTPVQKSFTVSDMVAQWKSGGLAPRRRRGSVKSGLTFLLAAVVLFVIGFNITGGPVTCGSQIMDVDDTCVVTSDSGSRDQTYEQTRATQNRLGIGALVVASGMAVAAVYNLGARIATRGRGQRRTA